MSVGGDDPLTDDPRLEDVDTETSWGDLTGVPDALQNLSSDAKDLLNNPQGYILLTVASWIVTQFFIRPLGFFVGLIEDAAAAVERAIDQSSDGVFGGLGEAGDSLLSVPQTIFQSIETGLVSLGLGAPLASSVAAIAMLVVFWTVSIVIARAIADAIPGGGGLIP
ncbi:MAG: hypothetical protein ACOCUO_00475 [archaeon]